MLQSKYYKLLPALALAAFRLAAAHPASASTAPLLPVLNWQQRSDWVNVKRDVRPAALGDGIHDDTVAIQTALNRLDDTYTGLKTVYFPPGTYRITKTLSLTKIQGAMLVGHGRTTRLVWNGPLNQTMFWSNGVTRARYIGLTWDGANRAAVGVDHASKSYYETRIRHQDEAFVNFRNTGIRVGYNQVLPTAEMMFRNCSFQNCGSGATFLAWNDYNNDFEGCDFRDCGIGVNCQTGEVFVRDSHFERSTSEDIYLDNHCHSVRRCTSVGSRQFISVGQAGFPNQVTVQDCHVSGWTGTQGAMTFGMRGPTTIFDCSFTNAPDARAPIRLTNHPMAAQQVMLSNNATSGSAPLLDPGPNSNVVQIPAGTRGPCLGDPTKTFFIGAEAVPTVVLDVKAQFGAKGDGYTDDTPAILAAINAAARKGGNALVYIPVGIYNVRQTLPIVGGSYSISGAGIRTEIHWVGAPSAGPVFSVQDPQGVSLEQMHIEAPDSVACIQQTSTQQNSASAAPSSMTYDGIEVDGSFLGSQAPDGRIISTRANRGLECVGLPASAAVHLVDFNGSAHFTDCSRATILQDFGGGGVLQVDGAHYDKSGFLGVLMKGNAGNPCDILVRDNQDLVVANVYTESTDHLLHVSGDGAYPGQPGHVTVQGYCNTFDPAFMTADNYEGRVTAMGMLCFNSSGPSASQVHSVLQTGARPVDLLLLNSILWSAGLTTQVDPGASLVVLQNLVAADSVNSMTHNVPNLMPGLDAATVAELLNDGPSPPAAAVQDGNMALLDVAAALDDYRLLGAVDLAINHP